MTPATLLKSVRAARRRVTRRLRRAQKGSALSACGTPPQPRKP